MLNKILNLGVRLYEKNESNKKVFKKVKKGKVKGLPEPVAPIGRR